ncbi:MAG: holA [Solirubrobacterales bacterium]|nr:holA [Solirubrobacterales bacterium]
MRRGHVGAGHYPSSPMPAWKPAFLIHGDDHGRVGERRARLREMAEAESGSGGVEVFEGDASTPELIALALNAMTFAMGRRFLVVDGVERWKDADVKKHLQPTLATMPAATTVAFFGREDGRAKVPPSLTAAVQAAGGSIATETLLKGKELPRWAIGEARKLGIDLEPAAARLLIELVGERQQRLLRELEKLALEYDAGTVLGMDEVQATAAPSAEQQVWGFVDALVARNARRAVRAYLELREQGESVGRLVPLMARRVREIEAVAARLDAGESPAQVKAAIKGSPWALDKRIKDARNTDLESLRAAVITLADLELATRGLSELSDDTATIRAIVSIAA